MSEEIFEKPKPKAKKARKPMTAEAKAILVKRLADARAVKKAKLEGAVAVVEGAVAVTTPSVPVPIVAVEAVPVKVIKEKKKRLTKAERSEREKSLEISNLRAELEMKRLRNELENLSIPKAKKPVIIEEPEEEPVETY